MKHPHANPTANPPARQLLALVAGVSAVHVVLLMMGSVPAVTPAQATSSFMTREIAAMAPPALSRAAARPTAAAPSPSRHPTPATPATPATPHDTRAASPALAQPPVAAETPPPTLRQIELISTSASPPSHRAPSPAAVRDAVPSHPVALLPTSRLHYEVEATYHGLALAGRAELQWRHDSSAYEARLEVGAPMLPTRVQTSSGRVSPEGLEPERFTERLRSERATHFERDKGKITFSSNRPDAELLAGTQDRLSVVLQLAAMVGGAPSRHPRGTSIAIPTAGTGECDTWIFTVEGDEALELPGGAVRAVKLQRVPRKEYDVKVELWLAPRLDYAPVRVRLTNPNGDSVDQRWSSTDKG
ncbi:MAG TPA: DUF3108 domain-containing protein [Ramlibacter sp.]|uniref:DUF3108 domain-containing protein n=1 Tax=Ramlibacter sp. TaxID=1917967 RepID=UPI002BB838F3|nr:DUF3108 domain-containing protein [Ramlibacter sp.]HVZ42666.1 DUF3108 domain-containing protein [Ramlibacter sp.]